MKNREDHIDFDNIRYFKKQGNLFVEHPMCRCSIILQGMVFMPDVTKNLAQEYITECKESLVWIN